MKPRRGVVLALQGSPEPAMRLGGISLVTRAALVLRRAGLGEVALVGSPELASLVARERGLVVRRFDDLPSAVDGLALVLPCHHIVAPAILAAMAARAEPCTATLGGRRIGVRVVDRESLNDEARLVEVEVEGWHAAAGDREAVLRHLLEDCRKPVDGFVARHFNRGVSLQMTARLVEQTWLSPNAMTGVMLAVSLGGASAASRGGYGATLLGAALMQLGSILDGVDGEMARIRFQESAFGAWLDTIADDATNVAFWAALGRGAGPGWLRRAGYLAAGANALAALVNYGQLARLGSGDLYALPMKERSGLEAAIAALLKQDTFLALTFLLALTGRLHQALPLVAGGALVTLGASLARSYGPNRK